MDADELRVSKSRYVDLLLWYPKFSQIATICRVFYRAGFRNK